MKKFITIFLAVVALLFLDNKANAQAFEKGNFLINLGTGFGVYGVQTNNNDSASGGVPGLLNLSLEYAISNKFGIIGRVERGGYLSSQEDSNKVVGNDFLMGTAYHFASTNKSSFYANILFGLSKFNSKSTAPSKEVKHVEASASGFTMQLNLGGNIYFSDHVGFFFELGYGHHSYSEIKGHEDGRKIWDTSTNSLVIEEDWAWKRDFPNDDENVSLSLKGVNTRIGLAIKF